MAGDTLLQVPPASDHLRRQAAAARILTYPPGTLRFGRLAFPASGPTAAARLHAMGRGPASDGIFAFGGGGRGRAAFGRRGRVFPRTTGHVSSAPGAVCPGPATAEGAALRAAPRCVGCRGRGPARGRGGRRRTGRAPAAATRTPALSPPARSSRPRCCTPAFRPPGPSPPATARPAGACWGTQ